MPTSTPNGEQTVENVTLPPLPNFTLQDQFCSSTESALYDMREIWQRWLVEAEVTNGQEFRRVRDIVKMLDEAAALVGEANYKIQKVKLLGPGS